MPSKLRLDHAGMDEILNSSKVNSETAALQSAVASGAQGATAGGDPVPVRTRSRTAQGGNLTARTGRDITLAHPAGLRVEAKYGTLARAAASAGLEVKDL